MMNTERERPTRDRDDARDGDGDGDDGGVDARRARVLVGTTTRRRDDDDDARERSNAVACDFVAGVGATRGGDARERRRRRW